MKLREILNSLTPDQRELLNYAFEHQIGQHVEYETGKFIGVNVENIDYLSVEQSQGNWSSGVITK
jgi:hypothetical protein